MVPKSLLDGNLRVGFVYVKTLLLPVSFGNEIQYSCDDIENYDVNCRVRVINSVDRVCGPFNRQPAHEEGSDKAGNGN